jgi:cytosine/adenosine deaminase-related metal-dependent hydrolase
MKILSADYVLPITSSPISKGAVLVSGENIIDVGSAARLTEAYPSAELLEFGDAAIIPGLINCHSHLEITSMRGALDHVEHDFSSWLLKLTELREGLSDDDIIEAAKTGAEEGARAGVTCFADIGRYGFAGVEALRSIGLRGIVYQETEFAADDRVANENFERLMSKYTALVKRSDDLVKVGLSPHSPYTVGPQLLRMIAQESIQSEIPISIHAAESSEEQELLETGQGFFVDVYKKYDVCWQTPHCSSIEYLRRVGVLEARPLLAHCVTASPADIQTILETGSSVAHCPKSNAKFGHGMAPLEQFIREDVLIGLGSDSVASNNVCDLLEEARFAVLTARNRAGRNSFISAEKALHMATLGGAEALRMDMIIGSLEAGKKADLAVISLSNSAQKPINDVYSAVIFASNGRDVALTMVNGSVVYRSPGESSVALISEISS